MSASLVFNQYINPIAFAALKWKYYVSHMNTSDANPKSLTLVVKIVYVVWIAFEFVFIYFFLVEVRSFLTMEGSPANGPCYL